MQDEPEKMVDIEVLTDGLVVDRIPRKRGEILTISEAESKELGDRGRIKPRPLMRSRQKNRLIGSTVCGIGETAYALSVYHALALHKAGVADILNAEELGIKLPPRDGEPVPAADGLRKLRATQNCHVPGLRNPSVVEGQEFEVEHDRALRIIANGHAEPVDWSVHASPLIKVRAIADGARIPVGDGTRICADGETFVMPEDDYLRAREIGLPVVRCHDETPKPVSRKLTRTA
jgi:hypothetical protein